MRYFFDGDNLLIDLLADGGTLTLAPADALASVPTATPVPPTATAPPPTLAPALPGSVVDGGPRTYATGT